MNRRIKFYRWFRFKVLRQDPSCYPTGLANIMRAILFPIETLYDNQDKIRYFPETDTYLIRGAKVRGEVFDRLSKTNVSLMAISKDEYEKWGIKQKIEWTGAPY